MDNDLFLFGVLVQRVQNWVKCSKRLPYNKIKKSIPCVHVHLLQDKSH
jgi:hypothetical protein